MKCAQTSFVFSFAPSQLVLISCTLAPRPRTLISHCLDVTQCAGAMCNDPEYPIVIYDENTKDCQCAKHPCGVTKDACEDPKFPMLDYSYDRTGDIDCFCRLICCALTIL